MRARSYTLLEKPVTQMTGYLKYRSPNLVAEILLQQHSRFRAFRVFRGYFTILRPRNQPKGTFVRRSDRSISSPYTALSASATVCLEARHAENRLVIWPLHTHLPDQLTIHEEDKAECIDC